MDGIYRESRACREEEDFRWLVPGLVDQLNRIRKIMNSRWLDYNRLFTRLNQ